MTIVDFFKKVVTALKASNAEYALAGGLIASLYRDNEHTTNDIDFVIFSGKDTEKVAASITKQFSKTEFQIHFVLPKVPWFEEALARAQFNMIDFGFGPIPCLTKEDVVVSKLYSLRNDPMRFNDLDDLKSIFKAQLQMDIAYICGQMQKLELSVPNSLKEIAPKPMRLTSKRIRRKMK